MERRTTKWREDVATRAMDTLRARLTRLGAVLLALVVCACGSPSANSRTASARQATGAPAQTPTADARPKIVILGDSLTAGLGLQRDEAYPTLLQQRLNNEGLDYEVVNAGVSGDTSADGLGRFDWAVQGNVRVLIVALGGNDGLRGLTTEQLKNNLAEIIRRAQARGITVILAGMEAPPNYGRDYIVAFHKVYPALAREYQVPLIPFLLQGVAGDQALNQPDGIHPTAAGARIVADNVWAVLQPVLATSRQSHSSSDSSGRSDRAAHR